MDTPAPSPQRPLTGPRAYATLVLAAALAFGASAMAGFFGWPIQFAAVGTVYALAGGWTASRWQRPVWPCVLLVSPWVGIYGMLSLVEGQMHVYPIAAIGPIGVALGAVLARLGSTRQRAAGALALTFAGVLLFGWLVAMPNWLVATLSLPESRPSLPAEAVAFTFADPVRPGDVLRAPHDFAGRVTVLDFWTTSCTACFRKFPDLDAFRDRYSDDPRVAVYSVNLQDTGDAPGQARAMMDRFDVGFETLYADLSFDDARAMYGFQGVPAVVVYGPAGEVASVGPAVFDPLVVVGNVDRAVVRALAAMGEG